MFEIFACIVIFILVIVNIKNKIQIKNLYEQVNFIKNHETNKMITSSGRNREINKLSKSLNELIILQRDLKKNYKKKDETLKEMITNISHDIRTPLTSLNGYFQLLQESDSEEEKKKYIDIIKTRISHLKHLLEDMFLYMKIQDNGYKVFKEECNVNKIVFDNLFSFYEDFKLKGIVPNLDITEKPIYIYSSIVSLNRIVNNLINNSLIHGKNFVRVILLNKGKEVHLIVENDVENSQELDIENIFTRFYKKDKSRTIQSTGLGLTIVKELVESMGGDISASINENIFQIKIVLFL